VLEVGDIRARETAVLLKAILLYKIRFSKRKACTFSLYISAKSHHFHTRYDVWKVMKVFIEKKKYESFYCTISKPFGIQRIKVRIVR